MEQTPAPRPARVRVPANGEDISVTLPRADHPGRARRVFVLFCIIAFALNLRAVVSSVGVSLEAMMPALSMSGTTAGLLTTLPVLSFAFFGATGSRIARALGLHRTAVCALAALAIGLTVRPFMESAALFITTTMIALAGAAVGNVILPPLVKAHFPDRLGTATALYSAALMTSGGLPPAVTVPIADAAGDWRAGLLAWAILAIGCLLPWLLMLRGEVHLGGVHREPAPRTSAIRLPMAWAMALCFSIQSSNAYVQLGWLAQIYVDAGVARGTAGTLVGFIQILGIPFALLLPRITRALPDSAHVLLPIAFAILSASGWFGILMAADEVPWLWAILLGAGGAAFPWMLMMIGFRSQTPREAAVLSSFVQPVGYLIAATGPFTVGLIHDATGSWDIPLVMLTAASCLFMVGATFARPRHTTADPAD